MMEDGASGSAGHTITLPENLDLCAASPLHSKLLACKGAPVCLDASKVAKVGAQSLQVLLSAQRTWERDGALFYVENLSAALVDALRVGAIPLETLSEAEAKK